MSHYDYKASQRIAAEDYPFAAIIMAAARKADSHNMRILSAMFPSIVQELTERYQRPGGLLPDETESDS